MIFNLAVEIVRWVKDYQPGIVACELVDADGRRHTFIEKLPIVTAEWLDAASPYPQPGTIQCEVLARWQDTCGREQVRISTERPYAIESAEGLSVFIVLATQLSVTPGEASYK